MIQREKESRRDSLCHSPEGTPLRDGVSDRRERHLPRAQVPGRIPPLCGGDPSLSLTVRAGNTGPPVRDGRVT